MHGNLFDELIDESVHASFYLWLVLCSEAAVLFSGITQHKGQTLVFIAYIRQTLIFALHVWNWKHNRVTHANNKNLMLT